MPEPGIDRGMRTLCLFFAVMQASNQYAVSPLLAEASQAHKHMTVPILKDKLHRRADFQVCLWEPRAVLWLLSLSRHWLLHLPPRRPRWISA